MTLVFEHSLFLFLLRAHLRFHENRKGIPSDLQPLDLGHIAGGCFLLVKNKYKLN